MLLLRQRDRRRRLVAFPCVHVDDHQSTRHVKFIEAGACQDLIRSAEFHGICLVSHRLLIRTLRFFEYLNQAFPDG